MTRPDPAPPRGPRRLATAAAVYLPPLAVVACAAAAHYSGAAPIDHLTRDPVQAVGFPAHYGAVSHVGVALWCAAAAVCFFAAALLPPGAPHRRRRRFLRAGGLFTGVLAADDLFCFHDVIFPDHLGVHEAFVVAAYGLVFTAYVLSFRTLVVRQTRYPYLAAACVLFTLSLASDREPVRQVLRLGWAEELILEDGLKLLGISSWLGYFALTAQAWVRDATPPAREPVASD